MFRPGDQIGPYTLISKLGKGAFGVVWLAERRTQITTTSVAIKIPLDDDISIETIKNEADVWVRASGHPNVLPIIEADIYGEHIVIASEYAPDGSLDAWLRKHGQSPTVESAVEIVSGILYGLEHLHSRNIIHRDLKPANILFQGTTPRLADFGISRVLKSTSQSSNIMGTPSYMAPEAFDGKRNEQTDIWSVGVIFYQLLSGRLPFDQADITSLLGAILTHNPEPLPITIPKPLQNVIARALAKDQGNRYKSAAEMRAALKNPQETNPNYDPEKSILTVVSPSINTSPPQYFHPPTEKKSNTPHFVYAIAGLSALVIIVGSLVWFNSGAQKVNSTDSAKNTPSTQEEKIKAETTAPPATNVAVVQGRKLIKTCMCCRIYWDRAQTIETSKSRVLVKFTESGKERSMVFGDFMKRDLSNFKPTELKFETVTGKQPDTVEVYQNNN
jgi:serine/threonine protein kinase